MNEEDLKVIEAMNKYGGGFVKELSYLFIKADYTNFNKLKTTFSEYWEQYKEMIKKP